MLLLTAFRYFKETSESFDKKTQDKRNHRKKNETVNKACPVLEFHINQFTELLVFFLIKESNNLLSFHFYIFKKH